MNVVFESCGLRLFCLSRSLSLSTLPFHRRFLHRILYRTTTMARKKVTGDELSARAKENGYQRGAHRDKDSLRDQNKQVDKVKKDQNGALAHYVL